MKVIFVRTVFFVLLVLAINLKVDPIQTDFLTYWTAGHRLVHFQNPYDQRQTEETERALGTTEPLTMRNPPWALFATAPIAWAGPRAAFVIWTSLILGALFLSLSLFGLSDWVPALLFAPVLTCLGFGQMSMFLLLGLALFLRLRESRPFAAGLSVVLILFKPHLFVLFGIILLVDCIRRRNLRIVLGAVTGVAIGSAFALAFDRHVFAHYIALMRVVQLDLKSLPTIPAAIRIVTHPQWGWIQMAPLAMGVGLAALYFIRNRSRWNWAEHGVLLVMLGVLTSPYEWITDEVLFIPFLMKRLEDPNVSGKAKGFLVATNAVAVLLFALNVPASSGAFIWTAATWSVWYWRTGLQSKTALDVSGFAYGELKSSNRE